MRPLLLAMLLGGSMALAQPLVPATAFLENGNADGVAEGVAIWRNPVDPDASRIVVAEGAGGLVHYALDGTDPQPLPPSQEVNGLAIAHGGGGLEAGQVMVATIAPGPSTLQLYILEFDDEGLPRLVSNEALEGSVREGQSFALAGSLTFSRGAQGQLYLFLSFSNEVEQLEVEVLPEGIEVAQVSLRPLLGGPGQLASDPMGGLLYAAIPQGGVSEAPVAPDGETGFFPIFSALDVVAPIDGFALDAHPALGANPAYLLVGNGVDTSVRVYDPRANPPRFVNRFRVHSGTGQTPSPVAGLALTTEPIGTLFPEGLLVVTSGVAGDRRGALVSWGDVARSFEPPLYFVEEGTGGEDGGDGGDGGADGGADGGTGGGPDNPAPGGPDVSLPQLPREDVGCGCTGAGSLSTMSLLLGSGLLLLRRRRGH